MAATNIIEYRFSDILHCREREEISDTLLIWKLLKFPYATNFHHLLRLLYNSQLVFTMHTNGAYLLHYGKEFHELKQHFKLAKNTKTYTMGIQMANNRNFKEKHLIIFISNKCYIILYITAIFFGQFHCKWRSNISWSNIVF